MAHGIRIVPAALIVVVLAGCGITDPYHADRRPAATTSTSTSTTATAPATSTAADRGDPAPERGGTIPAAAARAQSALAGDATAATPRAALERFARLYLNWTAAGLVTRQRQLAALSLGQARAQALQAAASAARDPELTHSHVVNTGQLIAITPGQGVAAGPWVLVCRETTTGTGDYTALPAALHVIYAQLTQTPTGWIVSRWSPES
jgi:hypothetical protein